MKKYLARKPLLKETSRSGEQEETVFVSNEEYEWLCRICDEPPTPAPRLRAAMAQKPVWEVEDD